VKKLGLTFGLSLVILIVSGWLGVFSFSETMPERFSAYGTWISILPPLVAIALALITREVIISLFAGVWIGALFIAGWNPFVGTATALETLVKVASDNEHMAIIIFSLLLGGMVGVMSRGGGTKGVVNVLGGLAKNRTQGQLFTTLSAFVIFFDDYANTLIRGNALRPMTDRLLISREKLSYIVDSTAAPVAVLAVITTWIGFEITQIQSALSTLAAQSPDPATAAMLQAGADNAFTIFLHSLPYLFYPVLALAMVFLVIFMRRDFGPMYEAERRAFTGGGVLRPGSMPAADTNMASLQPSDDKPQRWYNALVPVGVVIVVALIGLTITGMQNRAADATGFLSIVGSADPFKALMWASFTGCVTAILMVVGQKILTLQESMESLVGGMQSMMMAILILVMAWGLGEITVGIGTGDYLSSMLRDTLPLSLLPGLVFFIAAAIAFATGTSWGTMAILFPVVIPLAVTMGAGVGFAGGEHYAILLGCVSSVMGGAVFGDHCSPISDTTVLSAMSSACDLIDHVRTQLPYALLVAVVALVVGEIPAAFELIHPVVGMVVGVVILWGVLKVFGKDPEAAA
jgi:Na+/H+ antiporter NhaC